ncbi:MAG TPA: MarR family winged helix-turn-helix transcriptional regulator [Acidimicrobiales bacterium]|nr:MarR family winged helix-turn-helix transcriptional regulator [Acidimicrobiales bacterium]
MSAAGDTPGEVAGQPGATVGFLLSQLGAANARWFHEVLVPAGLGPRQFAILRFVAGAEGQSQNALGESLQIAPSRMVALIDELEEGGLVERRHNPHDRRAKALYVTDKGRRTLSRAMKIGMAHEADICRPLHEGERELLIDMLQRIAAAQGLTAGVHPELRTAEPPFRHDH